MSSKSKNSGYRFVKKSGGIEEYELKKNGLRVLLYEDHSFPVAATMVTYLVGARFEQKGYSGATHFLEHLLFKGSKKFNKKNGKLFDRVMQKRGAKINATTSFDRTNYYELVPSAFAKEALMYEGDRMSNSVFTEKDKKTEMAVVRNEFERGENDPNEALEKKILEAMFTSHPYRYAVIGLREDIEGVSLKRLKWFYESFYHPGNAYVSVIGDVSKSEALSCVKKYFGVHKKKDVEPPIVPPEPVQKKERRVSLSRAGGVGIVSVAFRVPSGTSADSYARTALSYILGVGNTSRLHKALVVSGKAIRVHAAHYSLVDDGIFVCSATLPSQSGHKEVEAIINGEINDIVKNGVRENELIICKEKIATETAFSRDGYFSIASELNEAIALGDWTRYTKMLPAIERLNVSDIKKAAKNYLIKSQKTTGWFLPKKQ